MIITQISLAGVDDKVSLSDIAMLINKFPNIELGLCLSKASMGKERYPTLEYIQQLVTIPAIKLSAHICGQWMKEILQGEITIQHDLASVWPHFQRVQFNYVDYLIDPEKVPGSYHEKSEALVQMMSHECFHGKGFIFPLNTNSAYLLEKYIVGHHFVQVLHDCSMGMGKLPKRWPPPFHTFHTGYAGGLSPDNILQELKRIDAVVAGKRKGIWIDAESGLRTNNQFDIAKATTFCQIISDY